MNTSTKTEFVIAFVAAALLLLTFGGGMATGAMMSSGLMGNGDMGGVSWMWLPTVLIVGLGAALLSVSLGKKRLEERK